MAATTLPRAASGPDLAASGRWLGAGVLAGVLCGAVVGGVGGRLAMMLLRFTSGEAVVGLTSDDGFEIGILSPATGVLVAIMSFLGVIGALGYLAARPWLPRRGRPAIAAAAFGIFGGAETVHADGIDFTLVGPAALAVVLFVALPALFSAALATLTERWLASPPRSRWWLAGLAPLALLPLGSLTGVAALFEIGFVWIVPRQVPAVRAWWTSRPVTWVARAALAAWLMVLAVDLASVSADVL
jgi:hypothetical protein